ncbi:MAG: hypothetical protein II319_07920, partial [Clostridia bacterium]|nr:hypothetical protein [Clostridia bacterium]
FDTFFEVKNGCGNRCGFYLGFPQRVKVEKFPKASKNRLITPFSGSPRVFHIFPRPYYYKY